MNRWATAAACAATACAACGHDRPAPKPAPALIAPDPSASASVASRASPPPTPPDRCVDYRRRLDARLHRAVAAVGDAGTTYGSEHWSEAALKRATSDAGLECFSFARGAWWIEPGADLDVQSSLLLTSAETIHASVDGRALGPWSPDGSGIHVGYGGMPASLAATLVSDYDGDGVPELWVRTDEDGVEGGHFAESWIVTVHDGKIGEYAPAKGLGTIGTPVDVDGDGRLDLPVSLGVATVRNMCFSKPDYEPADFLAHALPNGKFSTTDAVAMARMNRWCPAMPAKIATREDALCARLWAKTPADVKAARAKVTSCVQWDCSLGTQPRGAALDGDARRETCDQKVPFTLP